MITSALLSLSTGATFRTIYEILTILSVFKELFLICIDSGHGVTLTARVPSHSAFETHFEVAGDAYGGLLSFLALLNITHAARLRTPAQFWICIDDNILMEAQVFGVNLL